MHGSCQASATFVGVQQAHEFFAGTGVFGVAAPLAHGGVELLRQGFGFFAEDGKQVGIYSVLHGSSSIACAVAVGGDAASTAVAVVGVAGVLFGERLTSRISSHVDQQAYYTDSQSTASPRQARGSGA